MRGQWSGEEAGAALDDEGGEGVGDNPHTIRSSRQHGIHSSKASIYENLSKSTSLRVVLDASLISAALSTNT